MGFPGGSDGKESAYNAGDSSSIPGSGKSPGEGHGNPLQYSCQENPISVSVLSKIKCNLFFFSVAVEFIFSVSTSIALSKDHNLFIFPFIILRFYDYLGT